MSKFRYWKLTYDDVEPLTYDPDKILNWEIKCVREPEDENKFIGVFLYRNGTPHDYESKKGIVYYYNNIERKELPSITTFLKNRFNGNVVEKGERIFLEGSTEIYDPKDIANLAKDLENELKASPVISMELHDTTQEQLKEWGFPEAKLLPIPT
ncbi:MAG: hypothetical protein CMG22_02985 [Candidatus Marinimicrobia bacterium]|nr:hypothetical protein [Candidatus Neomarinimicrobiota bacterium]